MSCFRFFNLAFDSKEPTASDQEAADSVATKKQKLDEAGGSAATATAPDASTDSSKLTRFPFFIAHPFFSVSMQYLFPQENSKLAGNHH